MSSTLVAAGNRSTTSSSVASTCSRIPTAQSHSPQPQIRRRCWWRVGQLEWPWHRVVWHPRSPPSPSPRPAADLGARGGVEVGSRPAPTRSPATGDRRCRSPAWMVRRPSRTRPTSARAVPFVISVSAVSTTRSSRSREYKDLVGNLDQQNRRGRSTRGPSCTRGLIRRDPGIPVPGADRERLGRCATNSSIARPSAAVAAASPTRSPASRLWRWRREDPSWCVCPRPTPPRPCGRPARPDQTSPAAQLVEEHHSLLMRAEGGRPFAVARGAIRACAPTASASGPVEDE